MKTVRRNRPSRERPTAHLIHSTWTSTNQGTSRTGVSCDCGWKADGERWQDALELHASEHGIDLEAQQRAGQEAISDVYDMIWSRVLGPNYRLVVSYMTIEEAQALTHVGLNGNKDDEGRRAFEIVEAAIARIVGSFLKDDEPTIPMTSHSLEAVAPSFAHAVRRKDLFGLAPCLLSLEPSERAALMRALIEHETLRERAFYTSSLADEILTMVWTPVEDFPHFGVSFTIGSQYRSIVGLNEPLPEEVKEDNRRQIREAQEEGERQRARGEVDPSERRENALITQLEGCVRRLDVRTATRVLRGIEKVDRHFLLFRIRLDLDDESAVRFDTAVCEAAVWVFDSEKPAPGIADLLVTELLIALRESRSGRESV